MAAFLFRWLRPRRGAQEPHSRISSADQGSACVTSGHVHFSCVFEGEERTCDFYVPDQKTADEVAAILKKHTGENLLSIREEEIRED